MEKVLCFIDDILIFSPDLVSHFHDVCHALAILSSAQLKINLSKSSFALPEVSYLGHKISAKGTQASNEKCESILNMPRPTDLTLLRSFLGLANYYRRFVQNFSQTAKPLYDLLKKNNSFIWNHACETAFITLKQLLAAPPVLAFPDFRQPFVLATDASTRGIGAVLSQLDKENNERPIAFFSRTLSCHEEKYSITDLECLAVYAAIKHFEFYVSHGHFIVETDHIALCALLRSKNLVGRLCRWSIYLQAYDFEIQYKKGTANGNADAFSRLPTSKVLSISKDSTSSKIFVPAADRDSIISDAHLWLGHLNSTSLTKYLSSFFDWPNLPADVHRTVSFCKTCSVFNPGRTWQSPLPLPISTAFSLLYLDTIGPLPASLSGNKFIFVATDSLTKYIEAEATPTKSAEACAAFLIRKIIFRHGIPTTLVSDQGKEFCNSVINSLVSNLKINHHLNAPHHPESHGHAERSNYTLEAKLGKLIFGLNPFNVDLPVCNWDKYLDQAIFGYNIAFQSSLDGSPFKLIFGREPRLPLLYWNQFGLHLTDPLQIEKAQVKLLEQKRRRHATRLQEIQKSKNFELQPGDYVLLKITPRTSKLHPRFQGPYKISKKLIGGTYEIQHLYAPYDRRTANRRNLKPHLHENDFETYDASFKFPQSRALLSEGE